MDFPNTLLSRLVLLAALISVDGAVLVAIPHSAPFLGAFARISIVSYAVFIGLGYSYHKRQRERLPFSIGFFFAHAVCITTLSLVDIIRLHGTSDSTFVPGGFVSLRLILISGILMLALACIPLRVWIRTIRQTGWLWSYAVVTGAIAWCLRFPLESLWDSSGNTPGRILRVLTFHSVKVILRALIPGITVDPQSFVIGTPRFSVYIAEACSGFEGLGLVLVFTVLWLWYFRKESRFPQALLLIPCALICVWLLNIVRLSALILIGSAGAGDVAMVGFHSQAGWIAFTTVAFAFSMATRKLSWVRRAQPRAPALYTYPVAATTGAVVLASQPESPSEEVGESPATPAYLVPFLAILAASLISKAASGHFEWLYPLRFLAAAVAIWRYWPEYRKLDWRISWAAPLAGALVFVIWLTPSLWTKSPAASTLGESLAALSCAARWTWIAFRVVAAVFTVPLAEELAFRGYLARRWIKFSNPDFDRIPFSSVTVMSIALSSIVFGLMHGHQWFLGILAGIVYAGLMKWKRRLSDPIAAHATTNLLLAVWVLLRGDWSQW